MEQKKGRSPWVYVAAGCGCLVLAGVVVVVAMAIFVGKTVKDIESGLKDPVKRAERTREILGYQEPPPGYHPTLGFSIPFVGEVAVIADEEPDEDGELEDPERLFFYVRLSKLVSRDKEFQDILQGRADPSQIFEQANVRIDESERLDEGTITVAGEDVRYLAQRGNVTFQHSRSSGIMTLVFVNCSGGRRPGVGAWMAPEPASDGPAGESDLSGTPADPEALADFLSQFSLCVE